MIIFQNNDKQKLCKTHQTITQSNFFQEERASIDPWHRHPCRWQDPLSIWSHWPTGGFCHLELPPDFEDKGKRIGTKKFPAACHHQYLCTGSGRGPQRNSRGLFDQERLSLLCGSFFAEFLLVALHRKSMGLYSFGLLFLFWKFCWFCPLKYQHLMWVYLILIYNFV